MKTYDTIVIGSGSAMSIVEQAVSSGEKVALIDKGPAGGTCLNLGCTPTKMIIASADRVRVVEEAKDFGINAKIEKVSFSRIMQAARDYVNKYSTEILRNLRRTDKFDYYETEAQFSGDHTIDVDGVRIAGKKIFIGAGARPLIPEEFEKTDYLTSNTVLDIKRLPESIIIVGGGYIAAEYGHFFSAMGSKVTIVHRGNRLVPNEEPEVSETLTQKLSERMQIYTDMEVKGIEKKRKGCMLKGSAMVSNGRKEVNCEGQRILIAVGRKSNADILRVENTGVKTDDHGFIKVKDTFETTKNDIWAFGDVIGKAMYTHAANEEVRVAWHNSHSKNKKKLDYDSIPHAIFSRPQVASVGLTQKQAEKNHKIIIGKEQYSDVTKGAALREETGFAKAIIDEKSLKILGFHIIGLYAPMLIQEVNNVMAVDRSIKPILQGIHIHPALPELVQKTILNAK